MELTWKNKIAVKQKLLQIIKFGITGLSGLVIDFLITWLCKEKLGWNQYMANAIGFTIAVINNYWINRNWAFASKDKNVTLQFAKFLLVSLIGLALNTCCIYLLQQFIHLNFYISKSIAILIVFIWNYAANAAITFKN